MLLVDFRVPRWLFFSQYVYYNCFLGNNLLTFSCCHTKSSNSGMTFQSKVKSYPISMILLSKALPHLWVCLPLNEILRGGNFHFHYPVEWEQLSGKNKYQLVKWKVQAVNLSSRQTAMIWRAAMGCKIYKQNKIDLEVGPSYVVYYKLQVDWLIDWFNRHI